MDDGRYYLGTRSSNRCMVSWHQGEYGGPLDPRLDLRGHSPDGFGWGYGGSGPAQLALALLADATHDVVWAIEHYQAYMTEVISRVEGDCWLLPRRQVIAWCRLQRWAPPEERGVDLADPEIAG